MCPNIIQNMFISKKTCTVYLNVQNVRPNAFDLLQKRDAPRVLKYKQKEQLLTSYNVIVNSF